MNRAIGLLGLLASTSLAAAEPPRRPALGVGYKAGNGHGFVGVDVIWRPLSRVALSLCAAPLLEVGGRGLMLAPELEVDFGVGLYGGFGGLVQRRYFGDVPGTGFGFFSTFGYQHTWASGLGFQVGLGFVARGEVRGTNGMTTTSQARTFGPTFEIGLRYFFR